MAQKYKGTFDIPGGFGNKGGMPISDDMVVDKFNDLLNAEEFPILYKGMIVYCELENAHFTWNGEDRSQSANWNQLGGVFVNTNPVPSTIGGFIAGEPATPPEGLDLQKFGTKLIYPAAQPTISFNVSNELIEKGTAFSRTITISFDKKDAGPLETYILEKNGTEISIDESTLVEQNPVNESFNLRARVTHEGTAKISAGTISTGLATITPKAPQWKGSKGNNTSLNGLNRDEVSAIFGQPNIISNYDKGILSVPEGEYGFYISINSNAKIISAETNLPLSEGGAYTKSTISIELTDASTVNLTQYIIGTATGNFEYFIE